MDMTNAQQTTQLTYTNGLRVKSSLSPSRMGPLGGVDLSFM